MIANFIEKASRLYEQKRSAVSAATALEMYVRRWLMWATGGIVCQLYRGDHRRRYEPQNNVMSACRASTLEYLRAMAACAMPPYLWANAVTLFP